MAKPKKAKERFFVKRLGTRKGNDKHGDFIGVFVSSSDGITDGVDSHLFTAIGGSSPGSRKEAVRLCNMLNYAYEAFHLGKNLVMTGDEE